MSYDSGIPSASDSPGNFPAQAQTNWTRLETLVGADHQFNLAAAATDGYHNLIHMLEPTPNPSGASVGVGRLYGKLVNSQMQLFYMDDAGLEYQVSPTMPTRAAVCFDPNTGTTVVSSTIFQSYNVTEVLKPASDQWNVKFTNLMPDTNYMVFVSGFSKINGTLVSGSVFGTGTFANSITTANVRVGFSSSAANLYRGYVTVMATS